MSLFCYFNSAILNPRWDKVTFALYSFNISKTWTCRHNFAHGYLSFDYIDLCIMITKDFIYRIYTCSHLACYTMIIIVMIVAYQSFLAGGQTRDISVQISLATTGASCVIALKKGNSLFNIIKRNYEQKYYYSSYLLY